MAYPTQSKTSLEITRLGKYFGGEEHDQAESMYGSSTKKNDEGMDHDKIEPVDVSSTRANTQKSDKLDDDEIEPVVDGSPDVEKLASAPPPRPDSEENPLFQPKSLKFWLTLICNFLALFLVALDRTIIATAVPRITDEFNSLGDIGWYGSAYMLTTSSAQLVYGRIYKFYDMKWTFLISVIIFEAGSALCGAAPSSTVFIIGRAIAGLGSAGIFSGCMLIMIPMIPLHRRPMFQGLFGMVFGIASVMGPLIGGGFTNGAGWRWCFYLNLPIGAVTFIFMIFWWNPPNRVHEPGTALEHIKRLDPIGMFFFLPAIICLLLALQWGGGMYAWGEWRIILLFVLFGVLLCAFIAVQILKPDTAMVPPRIITQRSIAFGTSFTFFLSGSMLMLVYYTPIWFQTVQQADPLKSGIYTLPLVLSLVASSIISGIFTQKVGYYVPSMLLSPSLMSVGEGLMSTWSRYTPQARWIGYQFISGFGLGFGMQTSGLAVQTVLPPPDISIGIAINFFVQQLGGAVFTSVGESILTNLLTSRLAGIPGLNAASIVSQGATNLGNTVPAQDLDLVIDAYNYACQRIFLAAMGLAFASLLCALGMEWRSIKKGRQGPPGGPGGAPGVAASAAPVGPAGGAAVLDPPPVSESPRKSLKRNTKGSLFSLGGRTEVDFETEGSSDAGVDPEAYGTLVPQKSAERKPNRLSKLRPGSTSSAETLRKTAGTEKKANDAEKQGDDTQKKVNELEKKIESLVKKVEELEKHADKTEKRTEEGEDANEGMASR